MASDIDIAYCAGLIDGEGCIRVNRSKPYHDLTGCVSPKFIASIHVRMVDEGAIAFLHATLGGWYWREKKPHSTKGRPLFCWQATQAHAEQVLLLIRPHLRVKGASADNVLALRALQSERMKHRTKVVGERLFPNKHGTIRRVANKAYSDEYVASLNELYLRSRELNAVGAAAA